MSWLCRELRQYGAPDEESDLWQCNGTVAQYAMGNCAMAISSNMHFKYAEFYANGRFKGKVGVAPLPGSSHVLDRATGEHEHHHLPNVVVVALGTLLLTDTWVALLTGINFLCSVT